LPEVIALLIVLTLLALLALPIWMLSFIARTARMVARRLMRFRQNKWLALLGKGSALLASPHQENWVLRLYDEMQKVEGRRMQTKIAALADVRAWYCPTAFWPSFNQIKAPRLMCVPDVVLSDFPVGYSSVGDDRFLNTFETIGRAIREGKNFVTYSEAVRWDTLVDRYGIPASNIAVIPHAPNKLNRHVEISGFPDAETTSRHYCQILLRGALQRSTNPDYTASFQNLDVKFFFYASQLRPNKNVLMLLHAFEHLLRRRHLGYKLILTGDPKDMPEIGHFVADHRLEADVIFLHGLSISELAACYKLADLAVNPSLSEGGCPFTFTEALSVGTPVVMSRIPVAEEVLTAPALQKVTFFDPYDWRDCAERIEWGVKHRGELLSIQRETYTELAKRTWSDVVIEHVRLLDRIADQA
jgi:glycosyltransferase involved in cell wall biosynthesis